MQIGCNARNQVRGFILGNDPTATAIVLVNHSSGNADRLSDRTDSGLRQS
jgi:hypothetical protein